MASLSRPRDTTIEAWEFQLDCYRRMSAAKRTQIVVDLSETVHNLRTPQTMERTLIANSAYRLLSEIPKKLDTIGIPYMIVGSFASAYHGIPRSTQALDIVVSIDIHSLEPLYSSLSAPGCYLSREALEDAIKHRGQFNLIDGQSGWKTDFIVCKNREFSQQELGRRQRVTLNGCEVFIASAEDTILSKLEWARESQSERQLRDVAGILDVCGPQLDQNYLDTWIAKLGLTEVFAKAQGPW